MEDTRLGQSLPYLLGVVGARCERDFAARVAELDLKPKHVGLLSFLAIGSLATQREIAQYLGVTPALVVALADDLSSAGLITRQRDPLDRRRQYLRLTDKGRDIVAECAEIAAAQEAELVRGLSARDVAALRRGLAALARGEAIPSPS